MSPVQEIQNILNQCANGLPNRTEEIYINSVLNEFYRFGGKIVIPRISVKELDYATALPIVKDLALYIPAFFSGHQLLEKRIPPSDQHKLQFTMRVQGKILSFIHMFKIELRFGGDPKNITEKGDTNNHPAFKTDRIYYKSLLIPEIPGSIGREISGFSPIRIIDMQVVESDQQIRTSAIFDDVNLQEFTDAIIGLFDPKIFSISPKLFPQLVYDYFTACFRVLNPAQPEIFECAEIFEPLFFYIYSRFRDIDSLAGKAMILDLFQNELSASEGTIVIKDQFMERVKQYFNRFHLHRDDELSVKGWWRVLRS